MSESGKTSRFEAAVLEQLDAAHNLARWLLRNDQDAQDVLQESCLRALRAFDSLRGGDFRPWFLTIVRNTSFTWLQRNRTSRGRLIDQSLETEAELAADDQRFDPQALALRAADAELVRNAIDLLPPGLRETIILRELEGLSYKEIGKIVGVPIGTVMSRIARGRSQLQMHLMETDAADKRLPKREGAR